MAGGDVTLEKGQQAAGTDLRPDRGLDMEGRSVMPDVYEFEIDPEQSVDPELATYEEVARRSILAAPADAAGSQGLFRDSLSSVPEDAYLTIDDYIQRRGSELTDTEKEAMRLVMERTVADVRGAGRRKLPRAERKALGEKFSYRRAALDAAYESAANHLIATVVEAGEWINPDVLDANLPDIVRVGLKHKAVKGDPARLPGLFSRLGEPKTRAQIGASLERALAKPEALKVRLKHAGVELSTGVVTWVVAEKVVDAIGIENPTARFAAVIFLMHNEGTMIRAGTEAVRGSAELSAMWGEAGAAKGILDKARAAGRAAVGTARGMRPILADKWARAAAGEGLSEGSRVAIDGTAAKIESAMLRMGASAERAAAARLRWAGRLSLAGSGVATQVNAIKGLGGGLLAAKIAGLAARTIGFDPETSGYISTAAFFTAGPIKRVLTPTRLGSFASRLGLGAVARFGGQVAVAGMADDLLYTTSVGAFLGDESDYFWTLAAQNSEMLNDEWWDSMCAISAEPWYKQPGLYVTGVSLMAHRGVMEFITPGLTTGTELVLSDLMGASHWKKIDADYRALAETAASEIPGEFTEFLMQGIGDENMSASFYQGVDLSCLYEEVDRDGSEIYKDYKHFVSEMEGRPAAEFIEVGMEVFGEDRFNEAMAYNVLVRLQDAMGLFSLIDYWDEAGPLREIAARDGTVISEDALIKRYVVPYLVPLALDDPALSESARAIKDAVRLDEEADAARQDPYFDCDDFEIEHAEENGLNQATATRELILEMRKRRLIYRVLNTPEAFPYSEDSPELMSMARQQGIVGERYDPYLEGDDYEMDHADELSLLPDSNDPTEDVGPEERRRIYGELKANYEKERAGLMKLTEEVGLADDSGDLARTPLYYSALGLLVDHAERAEDPRRLAAVDAIYSSFPEGSDERLRIDEIRQDVFAQIIAEQEMAQAEEAGAPQ